jgi:hypothetical protein
MKFCWTRASLLSVRCPIDSGEEEWVDKKQVCSGRRSRTEKKVLLQKLSEDESVPSTAAYAYGSRKPESVAILDIYSSRNHA